MFQFTHKHCFPNMMKIDMGILVCSLHQSSNLMKASVQLTFGQKKIPETIMESEAYDMEGNNMWFKQGKFPK